jgi:hypothetical protein
MNTYYERVDDDGSNCQPMEIDEIHGEMKPEDQQQQEQESTILNYNSSGTSDPNNQQQQYTSLTQQQQLLLQQQMKYQQQIQQQLDLQGMQQQLQQQIPLPQHEPVTFQFINEDGQSDTPGTPNTGVTIHDVPLSSALTDPNYKFLGEGYLANGDDVLCFQNVQTGEAQLYPNVKPELTIDTHAPVAPYSHP